MRAAARAALMIVVGSVVLVASAHAQALAHPADTRPAATRPSIDPKVAVDRLLGYSPIGRRDAIAWAKANMALAVPLIAEALTTRPAARLSYDGIRALGSIPDVRLASALASRVAAGDFPWRPQALESIADLAPLATGTPPDPGFLSLFVEATASPVARTRAAAARGLACAGYPPPTVVFPGFLKLEHDPEAAVRLEAARAVLAHGPVGAADFPLLTAPARDLSLVRRFVDSDPGDVARQAAAAFLNGVLAGDGGAKLTGDPATQETLDAVLRRLKTRFGLNAGVQPTQLGMRGTEPPGLTHAVEVRSCIEGDLFLRFNRTGLVVAGRDDLTIALIEPGLVAPIADALDGMDTGAHGRSILGPVTCDFERFAVLAPGKTAWRTLVIGTGKRPATMAGIEGAIQTVIARVLSDGAAKAHARRIAPFAPR